MVAHLTFTRREPKKETEACDFCNVTEDTAYNGGTTKLLANGQYITQDRPQDGHSMV